MNCRACRSDRLDPVFTMDPMPLAGAFAATADEAQAMERYPLTWLLCHDCGLVNVEPDIPDELIYGTYSYAASTVPALVRHHTEFAAVLKARYGTGTRLLEIGCNDGVLLNQLPKTWDRVGVDPSDVARDAAAKADYKFVNEAWPTTYEGPGFDVVVSSNTFAHFTDIAGALEGVHRVLRPGGEFWIEVHDLNSTQVFKQWDTIYHEHKAEWSLEALIKAIEPLGFTADYRSFHGLHGGLNRVRYVKGKPGNTPTSNHPDWPSLQAAYDTRKPVKADAAYGAAARGTVYLNQVDTGAKFVVDGSPLRAGKFVPGLGIPVVAPEGIVLPKRTLITAWNHADDIKARHPEYDGWVTAW